MTTANHFHAEEMRFFANSSTKETADAQLHANDAIPLGLSLQESFVSAPSPDASMGPSPTNSPNGTDVGLDVDI